MRPQKRGNVRHDIEDASVRELDRDDIAAVRIGYHRRYRDKRLRIVGILEFVADGDTQQDEIARIRDHAVGQDLDDDLIGIGDRVYDGVADIIGAGRCHRRGSKDCQTGAQKEERPQAPP